MARARIRLEAQKADCSISEHRVDPVERVGGRVVRRPAGRAAQGEQGREGEADASPNVAMSDHKATLSVNMR